MCRLVWDVRSDSCSADIILKNFLNALPLATLNPKRIFIQYGQKWHGVHLGAPSVPDVEEQPPRLAPEVGGLYYTQHDILTAFCESQQQANGKAGQVGWGWNAALPSFVIGAARDSSQSLLFPLLVYAAVQKSLGQPLAYPGDLAAWLAPLSLSNAVLNSYMYEWCVLSPGTAENMFNASDDCAFTWGHFWPKVAAWFDMPYTAPRPESEGEVRYKEKPMPGEEPPHGLGGGPSVMRYTFSFVDWAKQTENVEAWKRLAEKHGLRESEWRDLGSVFGRADFALLRPYASVMRYVKYNVLGTLPTLPSIRRGASGTSYADSARRQHDESEAARLVRLRRLLAVSAVRGRRICGDEVHPAAGGYRPLTCDRALGQKEGGG